MKRFITTSGLALFAFATASAANAQSSIEGLWRNPSGTAIIVIAPCGSALCGRVAWASERGQSEVAKNTPRVVGTTVLTGVRNKGGHWAGSLYIPDDNIHVSAKLQLLSNRHLKLTGCAVAGIFCRSQVWTRADRLPT